jgi:hypothetical protein
VIESSEAKTCCEEGACGKGSESRKSPQNHEGSGQEIETNHNKYNQTCGEKAIQA